MERMEQWQLIDVHRVARRPAPERTARPDVTRDRSVAQALAREIARTTTAEVRFDAGSRALYATDASNYRQVPIGVVVPRTKEDILATLAACRRFGAPIVSRGGGTSLAGQTCNVAVVLEMSKHLRGILELDRDHKRARVLPGTVLDALRNRAKAVGLTFAPDPSTHNHCTLGGMIGNNSCGTHSVMAGRTSDNVESLEIATYDGLVMQVGPTSDEALEAFIRHGGRRGQIYAALRTLRDRYAERIRAGYPRIPRRISGYNLDELLPERGFHLARALVGTESTCVTVLEATLALVDWPPARNLVVLGYPDIYSAGDHAAEIVAHGPMAVEAFDDRLCELMRKRNLHTDYLGDLPDGGGWLLVEVGGQTQEEAKQKAERLLAALGRRAGSADARLIEDPAQQERLWKVRESGLGATARAPGEPDTWPGWEDSAVAPERLGPYLRDLRKLFDQYGYHPALYGHFGQGCVHCRVDFDLKTAAGLRNWRSFLERATDLVVSYGGSLSGEHGDGQSRAEFLPKMYGPELMEAFRQFKRIWDPEGKMNPGKVIDADPVDSNLRMGSDYAPVHPATHFQFPQDDGDFVRAAERCVGIGECRRLEGGTMCPSYRVTLEEKHSTRGRARMLFEMMRGEELDGLRDESVHEALDLCLSCKGCRSDCPVNVDMASYKAEFLAHYYEGRVRPRAAYSMGLIHRWARLAQLAPGLTNFVTQTPGLAAFAKWAAGIAPDRRIPRFAPQSFRQWFGARPPRNEGRPPVLLWPDTFNDHFHPETAIAAVEVLEAAGFQVVIPRAHLCCGRPLYDFGMLERAKRLLRQILGALRETIEAGVPLVGLEPSCVAVFRDELGNLFPHDEDAARLRQQTHLFGEFLQRRAGGLAMPTLVRKALVQAHCHHRAVMGTSDEEAVLGALGMEAELLDGGCCGMAGSFGFERGAKYEVSRAVGERALLPAVRAAQRDTLIVADGFSCREQIHQMTERRGLHLSQVVRMAMLQGPAGPAADLPEEAFLPGDVQMARLAPWKPALAAAGAALAAGVALSRRRRWAAGALGGASALLGVAALFARRRRPD